MIMKQSINVNGAPAAVGPYVHAVKTGNMIFISGQLGLNPADGTLPEGIEAQTIVVLVHSLGVSSNYLLIVLFLFEAEATIPGYN